MATPKTERYDADPGAAPEDPARRPGQPGGEDGRTANTRSLPAELRPPGYAEEPVPPRHPVQEPKVAAKEPKSDAAKARPQPAPLSDGSSKAGPV